MSANSEIEEATNESMMSGAASAIGHISSTNDSPNYACFPIEQTSQFSHAMFLHVFYDAVEHLMYNGFVLGPFIALALGIVNGALHATAWNSHFPSHIEALLWKISCFGVGCFPLAMFIVVLFIKFKGPTSAREATVHALSEARLDKSWQSYPFWEATHKLIYKIFENLIAEKTESPDTLRSQFCLLYKFSLFLLCGYLICMLYLTVESFLSIRSLPEGSYSVVSWSQFLPHI
jgi:hypothetical protein